MYKTSFLIILSLFLFIYSRGQPIEISTHLTPIRGKYQLDVQIKIAEGWHIYSMDTSDVEGIGMPTKISLSRGRIDSSIQEKGNKICPKGEFHSLCYYERLLMYRMYVVGSIVDGEIEYQLCTETECLSPQKYKFSINKY